MCVGIEIEYWLVDDDGILSAADEVITACDGVDSEMATPLLGVKTPPCDSVEELTTVLGNQRLSASRGLSPGVESKVP